MDNLYKKEEKARLLSFSLPILVELLLTCVINMGSQYYLNAYSRDAMAVVGSLSQVVNFVINLYTFISVGGSIMLAPAVGRKDTARQRELIVTMLTGNALFALAVSAGMLLLIRPVIYAMHIDRALAASGEEYLIVSCGLSLMQSLLITYTAVFRSMGRMKDVMVADFLVYFVCFLVNAAIYHLIPPDQQRLWQYTLTGITGQATGVIFLALRLRPAFSGREEDEKPRRTFIPFSERRKIMKQILRYGIPGGSEGLIYLIGIAVCTSITGMLGTGALLVRSYVAILAGYLEICMTAINTAFFPLVGQNLGRGSWDRIRYDFRMGMMLSCLITIAVGAGFLLFGSQFLEMFTDDRDVIRTACRIFRFQFLADMCRIPAAFGVSGLKAIGRTREPFIVVIISGITEVLLAYLLAIVLGLGLEGIFLAYASDYAFRGTVLCLCWKRYTSPVRT